jgi:isoleucyl-tRNA synthetase
MSVFKPVDTSINFPQAEAKVLQFWKDNNIFQKSLQIREPVKDSRHWVFYEGPPTANGKPHPGHVLTRVVKDLFPRYKTMCGYYVPRKAGWDTHGLPVEIEVEKELKLDGKSEVEKYGVEPFVRKCMDSVFRYTQDWEQLTQKIGFWIDLDDAYVTYHKSYVESVWWSLKELHAQGLLYKGHKILPWCPHCQTALSSHEVGQGYKEVEDPSVFVTFKSVKYPGTSFLAWTTTPWTLPSNSGLAVKSDTQYSHVKVGDETLIMASALVKQVMGKLKYEVTREVSGASLIGEEYYPLFAWALDSLAYGHDGDFCRALSKTHGAGEEVRNNWTVRAADFVTLDTGTGIVHVAPAFGADDYALGKKEGLPVIQLVGPDGKFVDCCGAFSGRFVKDADSDIIKDLKARGLLLKREGYKHDYPFCWRCHSPLIYFARGGWFIKTTQEIGRVIANNKTVDWHPETIRDGRFGGFLESNIDWALSRERYWGTPLPVWVCACGNQEAIGSFEELKSKPGAKGLDAFDRAKEKDPTLNEHLRVHKPWIDAAAFNCGKCGLEMRRTTEVIDCWYDSGAMPFAQWGYPHLPGSKEMFNHCFPADFISEAIDQTRGWFYSLITESTLLSKSFVETSGKLPHADNLDKDPMPYRRCLVLGHVCDEKGEKMSKSKGNYLDPNLILDEEGADALRWFFYSSTQPWTSARFSRAAVRESQKEFLLKLRNVYSFFVIYANIDGFEPRIDTQWSQFSDIDKWILSELQISAGTVRECLDNYDIYNAAKTLSELVESLSNWYVRRSRSRFWRNWETADRSSTFDVEKLSAYVTLYKCLLTIARLIAPFVPFIAEEIWQNLVCGGLRGSNAPESVHLANYPDVEGSLIDADLSHETELIREIASLGRAARSGAKLKTRQPLSKVIVVLARSRDLDDLDRADIVRKHEQVLLDELNVKAIEIAHQADQFVTYELKPNFKAIGAKHRELVPGIKEALAKADAAAMRAEMSSAGKSKLQLKGAAVDLTSDEVEVSLKAKEGFAAASGRSVVVVLDTQLTPELLDEGVARELVNRVNGWRSDLKLAYEQRVKLALKGSPKLEAVARKFSDFIRAETLATEQLVGDLPEGFERLEIDVDGEKAVYALKTV